MSRRKVWAHRGLAGFFALLAVPACLWWKQSILFVILLSLATQVSTEWSCAEAADDRVLADQLDRIESKLKTGGRRGTATRVLHGAALQPGGRPASHRRMRKRAPHRGR